MSTWSLVASAAPSAAVLECIDHSERGQAARDHGRLLEAKTELASCAQSQCPAAIRSACTEWSAALAARIPSLLVTLRDERGQELAGASVWLDGARLESTGSPVPVDPGPHTVRASVEGRDPVEQTLTVHESEQGRPVALVLAPRAKAAVALAPTPASPAPRSGPPLGSWILAGLGVAAVATGTAFEISGLVSRGALDTCAPSCDPGHVDDVHRRLAVGDVTIGVGLVALAAGAALWIFHPARATRASSRPTLGLSF